MLGVLLGAVLFWWNPTPILGLLSLGLLGFTLAPLFALLMAETPRRVGLENAENTIALQMAAVGAGTALLPGLIGTIGKIFGLNGIGASFVAFAAIVFLCHELS